jgi:N-acyl-phosphatidylethanolamine-hydrolysing phospholipase D
MNEIGNSAVWYVPLGLKSWMARYGITNCIELDWWQEYAHDDNLMVVGTPIQHWSGRHFFDVNSSLWSSFILKTDSSTFFHCGS